ncbi:MAG: hypothetical protein OXN17_00550 [Candidatus Poribacteria bacterium]|nr:hypothetical protein [Candidatus Poribacteria bacterium]MDE0505874.1 hypothetical protein [Candidatus Poribacteria bacterium]
MNVGITRRSPTHIGCVGRPNAYTVLMLLIGISLLLPPDGMAMRAGVAKRDVSFPELLGGVKVHDPLYARVLILDDGDDEAAIICLDMVEPWFPEVRARIQQNLGITLTLVNCSHTHSGMRTLHNDMWQDAVGKLIYEAAEEAYTNLAPVSLHAGRAPVRAAYNRYGDAFSQEELPWVNVLEARTQDGNTLAVLFEYAAHPVITIEGRALSADYPGYAIARIHEELGDKVMPIFAQGCGGNTNGYPVGLPLGGPYENAANTGRKLGDAVLRAMKDAAEIQTDKLSIRTKTILLPLRVPSIREWEEDVSRLEQESPGDEAAMKSLQVLKGIIEREEQPGLRYRLNALMLGTEWCLLALQGEVFTEYELWVNAFAPFDHTMVFAFTNDSTYAKPSNSYASYILTDKALALSIKKPHEAEASCAEALLTHRASTHENVRLPYAVGIEAAIKDAISSLWIE